MMCYEKIKEFDIIYVKPAGSFVALVAKGVVYKTFNSTLTVSCGLFIFLRLERYHLKMLKI